MRKTSHSAKGWAWRLAVAAGLDGLDFLIGRIPVFGTIWDVFMTTIGLALWGPIGLLQGWELADLTDQVDAAVPTLTITGLIKLGYELKR